MDYTGGSTGSSLAMIYSAKGYKAHFVSSDAFAAEKLQTMIAFGATLELVKGQTLSQKKSLFNSRHGYAKGWITKVISGSPSDALNFAVHLNNAFITHNPQVVLFIHLNR